MFVLAVSALFALTAIKTSAFDHLFAGQAEREPAEVVIDRTFSTGPGERLAIDVGHADVTLETGSGNEARVRITVDGRNMERARDFFEHLNFTVDQSGAVVSIRNRSRGSWNGPNGDAEIGVYVTVPEVYDADVAVAHGDVDVERLKGSLSFRVAHGDLRVGALGGGTLAVDVAHGDLEADRFMSEKIEMDVQHGDADIDEVVAAEINVSMAHGDIGVASLSGYPRIRSQHGDVYVGLVDPQGGEFSSAHGNVELTASSNMAADVDLRASEVNLASSYRFEGTQREGALEGRINGGGPVLSVRTTHGDVRLEAK